MDIRELKYFIQIADSASYSSAAEKLYISQPALSKVIQKMEEELGYDLFFTHQRQQKLTSEGERFYYKASRLVDEYNDLLKPPQIQETASQGQIFLGFPDVAGICLFSNLIADFSRLYPNVKLQIKENGSKRIMADVESGVLDVGGTVAPGAEVRCPSPDSGHLLLGGQHPSSAGTAANYHPAGTEGRAVRVAGDGVLHPP